MVIYSTLDIIGRRIIASLSNEVLDGVLGLGGAGGYVLRGIRHV
jgi:hypothetical protein